MEFTDILVSKAVKVIAQSSSKKRLFRDIAEQAEACYDLDASAIVDALLDRETLGPTGVGNGIALPHARLDGLDQVVSVFVRLEKPMDFGAVDRQPVDLVFGLFAPQAAGVDHLKALALVSRTLRDKDVCAKLRSNTDAGTLYTILTEQAASQAA
ncbi:PTS sugar transporter subunit IIA [Algirhabdus cladophorae]|uniref:PTS sugar transporter subunit IIA n=1 Tax=Algirhabdus cladophorae TaxID=3377108 RepID=UPI003B849663